jgi:DNA processing protein
MVRRDLITDNKIYWLGLKMVPGLRSRIYMLTERAGGPRQLWEADKSDLVELGIDEGAACDIVARKSSININEAYSELVKSGIGIMTTEDDEYPQLLREAPNHPKALFLKGDLIEAKAAVAIVGARRATAQGKAMAGELASELAASGVAIVSGAARGIDTAAHWGAIDASGITHAILGCGLDKVYPPENRRLFQEISAHGALLSEYPPGTPPLSYHFPARNRIVAGMCQAVVVVEAGLKSGALITADFALDYGREVFAAPGFSKSDTSRGANKLIKQGAYLIESAEDVLSILGIEQSLRPNNENLTPVEKDFLEGLGWEAKRFDEIIVAVDGSISAVSTLLLSLEIAGFIKKDISGSYIRVK